MRFCRTPPDGCGQIGDLAQPPRRLGERNASLVGELVVPSRHAGMGWNVYGLDLDDPPSGDEPRENAVEGASTGRERPARLGDDHFLNRVAVLPARGKRDQDAILK